MKAYRLLILSTEISKQNLCINVSNKYYLDLGIDQQITIPDEAIKDYVHSNQYETKDMELEIDQSSRLVKLVVSTPANLTDRTLLHIVQHKGYSDSDTFTSNLTDLKPGQLLSEGTLEDGEKSWLVVLKPGDTIGILRNHYKKRKFQHKFDLVKQDDHTLLITEHGHRVYKTEDFVHEDLISIPNQAPTLTQTQTPAISNERLLQLDAAMNSKNVAVAQASAARWLGELGSKLQLLLGDMANMTNHKAIQSTLTAAQKAAAETNWQSMQLQALSIAQEKMDYIRGSVELKVRHAIPELPMTAEDAAIVSVLVEILNDAILDTGHSAMAILPPTGGQYMTKTISH